MHEVTIHEQLQINWEELPIEQDEYSLLSAVMELTGQKLGMQEEVESEEN